MSLPLIRLQPWYPGQLGVAGSDVSRGLRWESAAIVLYVDDNHPNATGDNDGTDPEYPINSIQTAITRLTNFVTATSLSLEGSVIVVANEATIVESVIIPPTAPTNCIIYGAGGTAHQPTWTAATAAGTALTVRQEGWTIEGFTFEVQAAGTAIPNSYSAYKTTIRNCRFDGLWAGLYGIDFWGAPHRFRIEGCEFLEFRRADNSAFAICVTDSHHTNPHQGHILGNYFVDNENHVGSLGGLMGFNVTLFQGNVFHEGADIPATIMLDLRGGSLGENIVTGNYFGGTYSNAGGYYANALTADSFWVGNIAEATPGTVADNGLTVRVPA